MIKKKYLFFIVFFIFTNIFCIHLSHSRTSKRIRTFKRDIEIALYFFQKGDYNKTLFKLKAIRKRYERAPIIDYWMAVTYIKLQYYDLSIPHFEEAIKYNFSADDLHFEYGKALYALDELHKAYKAFAISAKQKYKLGESLYYVSFILQTLGRYSEALLSYQKIINLNETISVELRQASSLQMADIYYEEVKHHPDVVTYIEKVVIPQYQDAIKIDKTTELAKETWRTIYDIKKRYELLPNKMRNGRIIPSKKYLVRFSQAFMANSNVPFEGEADTDRASPKSSLLSDTNFMTRYRFDVNRRYTLIPSLRISKRHHFESKEEEIVEENQEFYSGGLDYRYEHRLFNLISSFILTYDFGLTRKAREAEETNNTNKDILFYSRSHAFSIAEKLRFYQGSDTTFRVKFNHSTSYLNTLHTQTLSFIFDHSHFFRHGDLFLFYFSYDMIDYTNDDEENFASLLFRGDYILTNLYQRKVNLAVGGTLTVVDTKKQQTTRGTETKYGLSFKLYKKYLANKLKVTLSYDWTESYSKDKANYRYRQSVYGLDLSLSL